MADECDLAQAHIEKEMELRLRHRPKGRELKPTGHCYNCGDKFEEGSAPDRLYCNSECAEDHEWFLNRQGMNRR